LTFADALDAAASDSSFVAFDGDGFEDESGPLAGVRLAGIAEGDGPPDPIGQMVSLVSAGRAYDADVAALQAAKQMDVEAIDVDRS
jgi:flagellar basal body rod protein FlgC